MKLKRKNKNLLLEWPCDCGDRDCEDTKFVEVREDWAGTGWEGMTEYSVSEMDAKSLLEGKFTYINGTRYRLRWNKTRSKATIGCTTIPAAIVRKVAAHLGVKLKKGSPKKRLTARKQKRGNTLRTQTPLPPATRIR